MTKYQIITPVADVYGVPDKNALRGKFESQLVFGEIFVVESEQDGWCKGACLHDGYTGYVEKIVLSKDISPPTHVVTANRTQVYRDDSMKSPCVNILSFGSRVFVTAEEEKFSQLITGEWIYSKHLSPVTAPEKDYLATAQKFLETPYYWGGRSGFGIDCSGLVQVCLARAGITVPRDTDEQIKVIGKDVETPQAGDIVFFKGHVGMMLDDRKLIHANAFHMKTTIEDLAVVTARSGGIIGTGKVF